MHRMQSHLELVVRRETLKKSAQERKRGGVSKSPQVLVARRDLPKHDAFEKQRQDIRSITNHIDALVRTPILTHSTQHTLWQSTAGDDAAPSAAQCPGFSDETLLAFFEGKTADLPLMAAPHQNDFHMDRTQKRPPFRSESPLPVPHQSRPQPKTSTIHVVHSVATLLRMTSERFADACLVKSLLFAQSAQDSIRLHV